MLLRACATALALVLVAAAGPAHGAGGPLSIVTTTTDLKALVEAVGGDRVAVESLAPPLVDPHAVEVKPGQLARLRGAALLVRVGLDHEPWLRRALATVGDAGPTPGGPRDLDASRGVTLLQTETPRLRDDRATPHLHGFGNPHYWLDPENARPITAAIQAALARLSPSDRERFEDNRRRFLERLDAGPGAVAGGAGTLARRARLVAMHDTLAILRRALRSDDRRHRGADARRAALAGRARRADRADARGRRARRWWPSRTPARRWCARWPTRAADAR